MVRINLLKYLSVVIPVVLTFSCSNYKSQENSVMSFQNDEQNKINFGEVVTEDEYGLPVVFEKVKVIDENDNTNGITNTNDDKSKNIIINKPSTDREKFLISEVRKKIDQDGGVKTIVSNGRAFAALTLKGSVVTWGDNRFGGDSSLAQKYFKNGDVNTIFYVKDAFAALKNDNSLIIWSGAKYNNKDSVTYKVLSLPKVKHVISTEDSFMILLKDGSVVTWKNGDIKEQISEEDKKPLKGIRQIHYNGKAFAALTKDESVITWGQNFIYYPTTTSQNLNQLLSHDVVELFSTDSIFVAVKEVENNEKSVVIWGWNSKYTSDFNAEYYAKFADIIKRENGIKKIVTINRESTMNLFALTYNDSIISSGFDKREKDLEQLNERVGSVIKNDYMITVFTKDGSIFTWGIEGEQIFKAQRELKKGNIRTVLPLKDDFIALNNDGKAFGWGWGLIGQVEKINKELENDVVDIVSNNSAFVALKKNGSVVIWEENLYREDRSLIEKQVVNVTNIFSTDHGFVAFTNDEDGNKSIVSLEITEKENTTK